MQQWQHGEYISVCDNLEYSFRRYLTEIDTGTGSKGIGLVKLLGAVVDPSAGDPLLSVRSGYIRLVGWLLAVGQVQAIPQNLNEKTVPTKFQIYLMDRQPLE